MPRGVPGNKARKKDLLPIQHGRNRLDRDKDKWYAMKRYAQGATYDAIAKELCEKNDYSISASAIREDIQSCLIEWKRENLGNVEVYIARELMKLDDLEEKARANFESSKQITPKDYASMIKMGYTIEEIDGLYKEGRNALAGNPAYLETIMNIQKRRAELLGIDKGNDVASNTVVNYNFGDMSEDALAKLADSLQDQKSVELIKEKADEQ